MIKSVIFLLFSMIIVHGENLPPFYALAQPLEKDSRQLIQLSEAFLETEEPKIIANYCKDVQETLLLG